MRCPSGTRRLGGFGLGKLLAGLGIVLGAGVGGAEQAQHVITFDQVAVHGLGGVVNAPEVAHLDQQVEGRTLALLEQRERSQRVEDAAVDVAGEGDAQV